MPDHERGSGEWLLPSTGRVSYLQIPTGPGVRWDGGIEVGSEIGLHYDPMLAKLITWAPTRLEAIERMRRALLELTVEGVETSRDFHLRVMEDVDFRNGDINIQWLERRLASLLAVAPSAANVRVAAIAGALLAEQERNGRRSANAGSPAVATQSSAPGSADASSPDGAGWRRAARLESLRPA